MRFTTRRRAITHAKTPERLRARLLAWMRRRPAPVQAYTLRPRPVRYPVRDCDEYEDKTRLDIRIARPYASGGTRRSAR